MTIWTRKNLAEFLEKNNIDISGWGKGAAKTFEHLFIELIKGECEIYVKPDGKVSRKVEALSINVFYKDEQLKEEYQRFKDGRIRRRKMDCSVAEKITKEDKNMVEAVQRAMSEELRITTIDKNQIKEGEVTDRVRPSGSYPGILLSLTLYKFDIELTYDQYHPYGYLEHQSDKDTYFVWIQRKDLVTLGYQKENKTNENTELKFGSQRELSSRITREELDELIEGCGFKEELESMSYSWVRSFFHTNFKGQPGSYTWYDEKGIGGTGDSSSELIRYMKRWNMWSDNECKDISDNSMILELNFKWIPGFNNPKIHENGIDCRITDFVKQLDSRLRSGYNMKVLYDSYGADESQYEIIITDINFKDPPHRHGKDSLVHGYLLEDTFWRKHLIKLESSNTENTNYHKELKRCWINLKPMQSIQSVSLRTNPILS